MTDGAHCQVPYLAPDMYGKHYVTMYNVTENNVTQTADYAAAQFLAQGTFGPRATEISNLSLSLRETNDSSLVFSSWLHDQIYHIQPTLHRAHFRRRANTPNHYAIESPTGTSRTACDRGSRWHAYTFTPEDLYYEVQVTSVGQGAELYALSIAGEVRTEVNATVAALFNATNETKNRNYYICSVEVWVGGHVDLGDASCNVQAYSFNPRIRVEFDRLDLNSTFVIPSPDEAEFLVAELEFPVPDVVILNWLQTPCDIQDAWKRYVLYNGTLWRHDVRIQTIEKCVCVCVCV